MKTKMTLLLMMAFGITACCQSIPAPAAIVNPVVHTYTNEVAAFGTNFDNPDISPPSNLIAVTNGFRGTLAWDGSDDAYYIGVWGPSGGLPSLHYVGTNTTTPYPIPPWVTGTYGNITWFNQQNPPGNRFFQAYVSTNIPGLVSISDSDSLLGPFTSSYAMFITTNGNLQMTIRQ